MCGGQRLDNKDRRTGATTLPPRPTTARASADGDDLFVYIAHEGDIAMLALVDYLV